MSNLQTIETGNAVALPTVKNGLYYFDMGTTAQQMIESFKPTGVADEKQIESFVSKSLALLFNSLKFKDSGEMDMQIKRFAYKRALRDFPIFAIEEAVFAFCDGEVEGHSTFVPATDELRTEVRKRFFKKMRLNK